MPSHDVAGRGRGAGAPRSRPPASWPGVLADHGHGRRTGQPGPAAGAPDQDQRNGGCRTTPGTAAGQGHIVNRDLAFSVTAAVARICGLIKGVGTLIRLRLSHIIPVAVLALAAGLSAAPALAAASGTWAVTGSMNTARFDDTSTLLPSGQVLEAGGSLGNSALATAELYSPASGRWALTGSMHVARAGQTATLLPGGKVLVAGGGGTASSAELYNPAAGTWAVTGSLHTNRGGQTATLLPNGEVLVAGGYGATTFSPLSSAELYNPATGTWAVTGSMTTAREDQTATLLSNGNVLVAGGVTGSGSAVASAELYNPATGKWSLTGAMNTARSGQDATLLPGGDVLVTAGVGGISGLFAELYNPATGQWSAATGGLAACTITSACRIGSSATLLGDGEVLVAGGLVGLNSNPSSSSSAILYNPATNAWTSTGSMSTGRDDQTANLLTDGQVLVAGGVNFVKHKFTELASAALYTP